VVLKLDYPRINSGFCLSGGERSSFAVVFGLRCRVGKKCLRVVTKRFDVLFSRTHRLVCLVLGLE
jgi:hypothetical protein